MTDFNFSSEFVEGELTIPKPNFDSSSIEGVGQVGGGTPYPKGVGDKWKDLAVKGLRNATGKISPTAEGILAGYVAPLDTIGSLIIDIVPIQKWTITKERRDQFRALTPEEKKAALMHEAVWAGLWVAAPLVGPVLGLGAKGAAKGVGKISKLWKPRMLPIEDLATWQKGFYSTALAKSVKGMKGLRTAERTAVKDFMLGDRLALKRPISLGKAGGASKTYQKIIQVEDDIYSLTNETYNSLIPEALRSKGLLEEFGKQVPWVSKGKGAKDRAHWLDAIYQREMKYFVGKEASKGMKLADATPEQMENVLRFMQTNRGSTAITKALETPATAPFAPIRRVAEYGEPVFKMFSKVYKPIKEAIGRTNAESIKSMLLLDKTLVQRGLREAVGSKGKTRWIKEVSDDILDKSNEFLVGRDKFMQAARQPGIDKESLGILVKEARVKSEGILTGLSPRDKELVKEISNTIDDFYTKLYQQRMFWDVQRKFFKAGVTPHGANQVSLAINSHAGELGNVLSSRGSLDYAAKVGGINNFLSKMQGYVDDGMKAGWFTKGADLKRLKQGLTLPGREIEGLGFVGTEREKMMMPFLEGYHSRVYQGEMRIMDDFINALSKDKRAFHTQLRQKVPFDSLRKQKRKSLQDTIASRVHSQAREMYFHDTINEIAKHAQTLPASWKSWTEHYVSRLMGLPSEADDWIAKWMNKTSMVTGKWDAYRVMSAARAVNDFTYMGFLGLKPFSAMRNMFQPLLMVPADLGGTKEILTLARGYAFAASKKGKKALDNIGVLGEFAPDIEIQTMPKLFNVGKKVKGVRLPKFLSTRQGIRDASLWMFRKSDEMNRYVSGGAAFVKWKDARRKVFPKGLAPGKAPTGTEVRAFMKKAGVNGRTDVTKTQIESLVRSGHFEDARSIFVKDVVADTQYLYGHADSPLIGHQWGGVGKTGMVFQSWWMNYVSALSKWSTTGTMEERFRRAAGMMASHSMAYVAMRQIWDDRTALSTIALGPIPTELPTPPVVDLFTKIAKAPLFVGRKFLEAGGDPTEEAKRQMIKILKTGIPMALPGGLQMLQSGRGASRDGFPGLAKSIIKYNGTPGFPFAR